MGFGSRSVANKTSYQTENGGSGKSTFFPSASGPNGTRAKYTFRILPDTEDRVEDEVLFREWKSNKIMVNGRPSLRSCIVAAKNPIDDAMWAEIAEIDAMEGLTKEAKLELKRPIYKKQTNKSFAINVFNCDTGNIQILKGSWEPLKRVMKDTGEKAPDGVTEGTILVPDNPKGGGKTVYYKIQSAIQEGVTVPSKTQKLKRDQITDPNEFELFFYAEGEMLGKSYTITPGVLSPFDTDILSLPRWDISEWVEDKGVWPTDAINDLLNGADYYETAKKYAVLLFPKQIEVTQEVSVDAAPDTDDGDPLFAE